MGPTKKAILWGHKLHSHTHSYVHEGFYRAFAHLGWECYWLDDDDDIEGLDLSGALFLTEGQVDGQIPLRRDCCYVLHNCDRGRYDAVSDHVLALQVYTAAQPKEGLERLDDWTFYADRCLHQPWATDLLPHEIDLDDDDPRRERTSYWVGTIGGGTFGNVVQLASFRRACADHDVAFVQRQGVEREEHRALIRRSWLAPAIHGAWQVEHGYIACRTFKNVSYGQLGLTNATAANPLFEGTLLVVVDGYELFCQGDRLLADPPRWRQRVRAQRALVRERHTYLNRIARILEVLP